MNQLEVKQQEQKKPQKAIKKTKEQSAAINFLKSFFASLLVMTVFVLVVYHREVKSLVREIILVAKGERKPRLEFTLPFAQRRQNILVMGVDINYEGDDPFKNTRTDSMVLISIAPYAKDINVISIPRDSKVYLAGNSKPDKINHAFAYGGVDMSVRTVEETFGVRVNRYLVISNKGVIDFIDAIGGMPIYVEKDLHYGDRSAGLHVNLKKGKQKLSGKEVEGYLRFRNDELGDIGRISRQQWFFDAALDALKDPQILSKLPEAIKGLPKYIQTDMSIFEITQYAMLAKTIDKSDIHVATIPGGPSTKGEVSYWILDPEKTQAMIDKLVYRDKAEMLEGPVKVGILHTPATLEEANKLKEVLEKNGLEVTLRERKKLNHDHIAIHNMDIPEGVITQIKKTVPELKDKQTVYDAVGLNSAGGDFTVVLAGDK